LISPHLFGVLLATLASVFYGSGDFLGGFVTRRINHFQALILSSSSGIVVTAALALVWGEPIPSPSDALWAALAGVSGALGLGPGSTVAFRWATRPWFRRWQA
jgi:hypothetical protein